jgi:hypothetical protein
VKLAYPQCQRKVEVGRTLKSWAEHRADVRTVTKRMVPPVPGLKDSVEERSNHSNQRIIESFESVVE